MKKLIASICAGVVMAFAGVVYAGDTYVQGYTKKDGTYVQGHYRSSPNSTSTDNWSTKGNTNPYTGKAGTKSPTDNGYGGYGQQKQQKGGYYQ